VLNQLLAGLPFKLNIFSAEGIMWVMGLYYVPYAYLFMLPAFNMMDPTLEEAARTSGANVRNTGLRITLPLMLPGLMSSIMLVFVMCAGHFAVAGLLGIPNNIHVLTTRIYSLTNRYPSDYNTAAVLASVLVLITIVAIAVQRRYLGGRDFTTVTGKSGRLLRVDLGAFKYITLALGIGYLVVAVLLPGGALLVASFSRYWSGSFDTSLLTLNNYRFILFEYPSFKRAISNTLLLSLSGATIGIVLSFFVAYAIHRTRVIGRAALDFVASLPVAIPGLVFAMGMAWAYIRFPVAIYGTIWLLILAYVSHYLPIGVRAISSNLQQLSKDLEESGRVVGANRFRVMRSIVLPLTLGSVVSGWTLLFIIFSREIANAILLYTSRNVVLSVVMFDLWSEGRQVEVAVLSLVQVLLIGIPVAVAWRFMGENALFRGDRQ